MPLKVMSYNVGAHAEARLPAIVDVIRAQEPDVVALLDPETESLADAFAHELGMTACFGIDFIFASPALAPRLHACDVVASGAVQTASHHFPIWAEFR